MPIALAGLQAGRGPGGRPWQAQELCRSYPGCLWSSSPLPSTPSSSTLLHTSPPAPTLSPEHFPSLSHTALTHPTYHLYFLVPFKFSFLLTVCLPVTFFCCCWVIPTQPQPSATTLALHFCLSLSPQTRSLSAPQNLQTSPKVRLQLLSTLTKSDSEKRQRNREVVCLMAQQSDGKANSTLGSRPACLKAETKMLLERRKVVRAVELKKETWFRKSNRKERKVCPQRQKKQTSQVLVVYLPCTSYSINVWRGGD